MDGSPFNPDELAAQVIAGGGPRGGGGIREFMPEQHRHFFAQLPFLFVGAVDGAGWPLATLLTGRPGFVQSPDPVTLHIAALPDTGDPAAEALAPARDIGILGIDFSTRRRNRANGRILGRDAGGPVESFDHLDEAAQAAIERADTFFVASRSRAGKGAAYGADISHRGGRPGFVRVDGDVLTIPDFRGNRYFNSLGNLIAEPRASLLFVDFETGDLLQLQGMAQVDWNGAVTQQFAGAERLWRFHTAHGWRRKAASPLRWSLVEYSRTTLQTGLWHGLGQEPLAPAFS